MSERPSQPNQSLIDGLACLQWLVGAGEPVGSRELAREMGMEVTRANRLLKTLASLGLAEQDENRKYGCGPGVHVLAAQAMTGSRLLHRAGPALSQLEAVFPVVALGVLWQDRVSYLYHAIPGQRGASAVGRVSLFPAIKSGLGHALLAGMDDEAALKCVVMDSAGREQARLLKSLADTRRRGYARVPTSEPNDKTQSFAVALSQPGSAAIGVSCDLKALGINARQIAKHLRDAVATIESE